MTFIEKHPVETGFAPFYERHVQARMAGLMARHTNISRRRKQRGIAVLGAILVLMGMAVWLVGGLDGARALVVIGAMAVIVLLTLAGYVCGPVDDCRAQLGDAIQEAVADFLGDAHYPGLPPEAEAFLTPFEEAAILPFYSQVELNDYLVGRHRELVYDCLNARLIHRLIGVHIPFSGLLVTLPSPISAPTPLRLVKGLASLHPAMRERFATRHDIPLAGPLADAGFRAFAVNPQLARLMVENDDVQKVARLSSVVGEHPVVIALTDTRLLLALERGEGGANAALLDRPDTIPEEARRMLHDARLPGAIIDILLD